MARARGGISNQSLAALQAGFHCMLADNRVAAHLHLAEGYVSRAFCIKPRDIYIETRGPKHVAEARQLVMYLAHVQFGMSLSVIGRRYLRDRSTASYACKKIENKRDDPEFDDLVSGIEERVTLNEDPLFQPSIWRRA